VYDRASALSNVDITQLVLALDTHKFPGLRLARGVTPSLDEVFGFQSEVDFRHPMILEDVEGVTVLARALSVAGGGRGCCDVHACLLTREDGDGFLEVLPDGLPRFRIVACTVFSFAAIESGTVQTYCWLYEPAAGVSPA
jgi:hypothetical protein